MIHLHKKAVSYQPSAKIKIQKNNLHPGSLPSVENTVSHQFSIVSEERQEHESYRQSLKRTRHGRLVAVLGVFPRWSVQHCSSMKLYAYAGHNRPLTPLDRFVEKPAPRRAAPFFFALFLRSKKKGKEIGAFGVAGKKQRESKNDKRTKYEIQHPNITRLPSVCKKDRHLISP
ncbi:MAG: hypothetical protein OXR72_00635 [Gemmatimonadota bacterium]|nr:hypothetical protein [Gemmatimonadota bacterium]